ncbi:MULTISPECIES: cache domain-containing protein [unclassified Mycolicibacterium]|uniref:cache domain-containing protein n=1 Tax=unclassified Mycolicibacterium TaxID=2636767 RepID=UPI0012DC2C11|nr:MULTISPECIES: cache domain-containing protein [unclassified Mycolicibacterium]MUL82121.1 hypothetical protein [Mycolicibacterium sp. CBMA 329]MUL87887.1 hypothetical protein [Mycolicibacterium sp. CBMA 331]MUM01710.1 hypothetical protein [Mycolicibacterium sp. CBMA 334]MUM28443.1 hypothetical protein [Mycolicibacterium sp. CBMA 295]MUM38184.1 hypothetical protein [Mycolicibacterium sp. CBMA 247]
MTTQSGNGADPTIVRPVSEWFSNLLAQHMAPLEVLSGRIAAATRRSGDGPLGLSLDDAEALVDLIDTALRESRLAIGHGFIAAPDVVDGRDRYMLWLQRDAGVVKRLRLNFDTTDLDAYDYVNMDWYTKPIGQRTSALTGPYLDYAGADRLVVTVTAPIFVDDAVVGVVATDLIASELEAQIARQLRTIDAEVLVVNEDRAVIATNSPRWMPGERLRAHPHQDPDNFAAVVPLESWTGWSLAVAVPIR